MKINTVLKAVALTAFVGVAATYAFDKPELSGYTSADNGTVLAPNETPVLMRQVEQLKVYKLMDGKNCTGLVIADKKLKMYQRLYDISCNQPSVSSVSISPLALPNLVAVDFYHNAELIGRITLNRGDVKDEINSRH
ncbi:hypothetical protein pEaSNUABM29_00252 [Erwinia phage pEa_SNUABM_29]|nr:hypothetical protein pEaSNUABM29_00252 [Erwinia phage pEa_SNUABM_29]